MSKARTEPAEAVITDAAVTFTIGDREVGTYVLDDGHKPYLHPMRTLEGWVVSLAKPFDHPHHRGLMYGLQSTDVDWWGDTEFTWPIDGVTYTWKGGAQTQEYLTGAGPGTIRQRLRWAAQDGTCETFVEDRTIRCSRQPGGFVRWEWTAAFDVLRDVRLLQSAASQPGPRGRRTNYHGLGHRFPRSFGWVEPHGRPMIQSIDGVEVDWNRIMGSEARELVVTDLVDGAAPAPQVSVRFTQPETQHAIFFLRQPFTTVGIGPSNKAPIDYAKGTMFRETYWIDVADGTFG